MKVIVVNQKVAFARVWSWRKFRFEWFRVMRGGEDWRPLPIGKKYVKLPGSDEIKKALKSIDK